jgi:hypothetical protein
MALLIVLLVEQNIMAEEVAVAFKPAKPLTEKLVIVVLAVVEKAVVLHMENTV